MHKLMFMLSLTEENYLKEIYHLSGNSGKATGSVSTNQIAEAMKTAAASATDMIKKLAGKKFLIHQRYQGVKLTKKGQEAALKLIRKHRLWESFLVNKLHFNWDEVHDVAEQLEHIKSPLLISRLDEFLGYPRVDPHGDPIPDANGRFPELNMMPLSDLKTGAEGHIVAVADSSSEFLQYLDKAGISIGSKVNIINKIDFDESLELLLDDNKPVFVSHLVSKNLLMS